MSNKTVMKVTNIQDLQKYKGGQMVELPPFAEGQPFVAMMKRPSMLALAKENKIPNSLLISANELFAQGGNGFKVENEQALKEVFEVIDVLCEASFIEPTYAEIVESGLTLTDEQYMFIFNYTQVGVKALEEFR